MNKKNITIIATGGTIAGRGSLGKSANYEAGTFDVEEIVKSIPQIRDLANLNTIQLYNVDSNDMGLDLSLIHIYKKTILVLASRMVSFVYYYF